MKLTKPQWFLLVDIGERDEVVYPHYKPGLKLIELGYATSRPTEYGYLKLTISNAGRTALKEG